MIAFLDANVLYPTVLREIFFRVARAGLYTPVWSPRVLEEWARTAAKHGGAQDEFLARGEIVALGAAFPGASIQHDPADEARFWLPDPSDIHVLAAAVAGKAAVIVTQNLKDFPRSELEAFDMRAEAPDAFLRGLHQRAPGAVTEAVLQTHAEAERLSGQALPLRNLMKRARLPRLGKTIAAEAGG